MAPPGPPSEQRSVAGVAEHVAQSQHDRAGSVLSPQGAGPIERSGYDDTLSALEPSDSRLGDGVRVRPEKPGDPLPCVGRPRLLPELRPDRAGAERGCG